LKEITMKRVLILTLIFLSLAIYLPAAGKNLVITVSGNYFSVANTEFKQQYGNTRIFPEGKIALRLKWNIFLWGSYGLISNRFDWKEWSNKGLVAADREGESVSEKMVYSAGLGYYAGYLEPSKFSIRLEVGACSITHNIETQLNQVGSGEIIESEEKKESGIGIRGTFGITFGLLKNLFSEATIGYIWVTDKVDDERINLGGFRASVGLGLAF
jgi:hypothetical protein